MPELTRADCVTLYRQLQLVRHFEDRVVTLYRQGKIQGGVFTGQGQEAIPVGTCYALRPDDLVSPVHRDIGVFLSKGTSPKILMAQIAGRKTGLSQGKDSWTHSADMAHGVLPSTSMLASTIPVACGAALGRKQQGSDAVVVSYFGEGATARGDFHEGLNFAAIFHLPILFVCENNQYAYSTPPELEMPTSTVGERACAYAFPGRTIDGNNVIEVYETMVEAVGRARRGDGPTLIECVTYRRGGHSAHDNAEYQPEPEVADWEKKDPILRFEQWMAEKGYLSRTDTDLIHQQVDEEIREAVEFALQSEYPSGEEVLKNVYAD